MGHEEAPEPVMSAGGDFGLVFTVRPGELEAARSTCEPTVIGDVVKVGIWTDKGRREKTDRGRGYENIINRNFLIADFIFKRNTPQLAAAG